MKEILIQLLKEAIRIFKDKKYLINQYKCMLNEAEIQLINKKYPVAIEILTEIMNNSQDPEIQEEGRKKMK